MFDRQALFDIMSTEAKYVRRPADMVRGSSQTRTAANTGGYELASPYYSDQIPPFDVTLVGRPNKGM